MSYHTVFNVGQVFDADSLDDAKKQASDLQQQLVASNPGLELIGDEAATWEITVPQ